MSHEIPLNRHYHLNIPDFHFIYYAKGLSRDKEIFLSNRLTLMFMCNLKNIIPFKCNDFFIVNSVAGPISGN